MMRFALVFAFALLALGGAYRLYQEPRVQELLKTPAPRSTHDPSVPSKQQSSAAPLKQWARTPKLALPRSRVDGRAPQSPVVEPADVQADEPIVAVDSQLDNGAVGRILLQILAAKKLVDGVTLGVTDHAVTVSGTLDSEARRRQILGIIDQGCGSRRVDAEHLVVASVD